jgi:hypothetical protein
MNKHLLGKPGVSTSGGFHGNKRLPSVKESDSTFPVLAQDFTKPVAWVKTK